MYIIPNKMALAVEPLPAVTKFSFNNASAISEFVGEGFVIYHDLFDQGIIRKSREFLLKRLSHMAALAEKGKFPTDINGWSVAIVRAFERTELYEQFIRSPAMVMLAKQYVGPDVAWFEHPGLFINVPRDSDPVSLKGDHSDVWAGNGVNTVFATTFFTDVDKYNGMSVCPRSHLQGLPPVRNRVLDPACDVEYESLNLDMMNAGDTLVWHPLLIHSTTGHSDKNIRISMTSRFTSTETPMTSQERALGYRTLSVGPLNQVLRLVGNDYLTPFRTLGGYAGVDRRMRDVYNYSPYKITIDYDPYLRDVE